MFIPNHTINYSGRDGNAQVSFDFTEVNRAIEFMESNAGKEMANAIAQALRRQASRTQSYINQSVPPNKRVMGKEVADSIGVDIGVTAGGEAQVRFGSEPMDEGGVTGSRGGKLALMKEEFAKTERLYGFQTDKFFGANKASNAQSQENRRTKLKAFIAQTGGAYQHMIINSPIAYDDDLIAGGVSIGPDFLPTAYDANPLGIELEGVE